MEEAGLDEMVQAENSLIALYRRSGSVSTISTIQSYWWKYAAPTDAANDQMESNILSWLYGGIRLDSWMLWSRLNRIGRFTIGGYFQKKALYSLTHADSSSCRCTLLLIRFAILAF